MAIKLDKDLLFVEQNKNCLLDATNFVKKSDKCKWVYSGYGMAFDGKVLGVLVPNDFTRNVVTLGVNNNSSSHFYNRNNSFLL